MNPFGSAWLLDREGNCIEVYAHPSEKFEFESIVDVVSSYNMNDPYNDYKFMLDMFNKRSEPTVHQRNKVTAIIMSSIIPYCRSKIKAVV